MAQVPPTERVDGFPPCHPTCLAQRNDGKIIFRRHYDINNLRQCYRKEKEESKETMALEVVTDGQKDKTEQND